MTKIIRSHGCKLWVSVIMTAVMVLSLCAGIGIIWKTEKIGDASASQVVEYAAAQADVGTSANPFTIVEIVPNLKMAQFGYLVGGQEPVDLDAVYAADRASSTSGGYTAVSTWIDKVDSDVPVKTEFAEKIPGIASIEYNGTTFVASEINWLPENPMTQYGYFEYVSDESGEYRLSEDTYTEDGQTYHTYSVDVGAGHYRWVGYDYVHCSGINESDRKRCLDYIDENLSRLTDERNAELASAKNSGSAPFDRIYSYLENRDISSGYVKVLKNKELFKTYALGLAYRNDDIKNDPETTAYKFLGWYKDSYGVEPFSISAEGFTDDITLYAKWMPVYPDGEVESYTIRFTSDGDPINMPSDIGNICYDSYICAPDKIPVPAGIRIRDARKELCLILTAPK